MQQDGYWVNLQPVKTCRNPKHHHLIRTDYEVNENAGIPDGWYATAVRAYTNGKEVIVVGDPTDDPDGNPDEWTHNCDEMGCGFEHVLLRLPITHVNVDVHQ